ncbi:MAG: DUF2997 domain-containing protein, partial [Deltaproteobacteria bacterium]|nr:DUF2997 domain-containing protein [Deltaproteobacteria bacterium]
MKEIVLTFNTKTGLTQVEANGFKGQACKQATMFLGDALGKVQD